ncbi:hypothetical protein N0V85_003169 [Neurospora sp. IMI 360204]|nr:hypothetical protein N0V85_003169 [Neurospora sp. IMI 360204]
MSSSSQFPTSALSNYIISDFITHFFQVSDNPDLTEEWVSFFGLDAKLVMGHKVAEGREEIHTLRKSMWERVEARKHTVEKVFSGGFSPPWQLGGGGGGESGGVGSAENLEFMAYGTVVYTSREAGEEERMDWAAHGELVLRSHGEPMVLRGRVVEGNWEEEEEIDGDGGEASSERGNTSVFVFKSYRVYLSPSVEY